MSTEDIVTVEKDPIESFNFKQIIQAAKSMGITSIIVSYAGDGDSGSIEDISFTPGGKEIDESYLVKRASIKYGNNRADPPTKDERVEKSTTLDKAIHSFFYDVCDGYDINFNDQGCNGSFKFNVETEEIEVENNYPVMHTESYCTKFK